MRPHHLLCLPGYKGISYSKEHANNWDRISKLILQYPEIRIKIISGQDTLCKKCPNSAEKNVSCNEKWIKLLDEKVKSLVGLVDNKIYTYKELSSKVKDILNPTKHKSLCGDCQWRIYGLCKDTFSKAK